jgi:hypothetical protein
MRSPKDLWYSLPPIDRYLITTLLPILGIIVGLHLISVHYGHKADSLSATAAEYRMRVDELTARASSLDRTVAVREATISTLSAQVEVLKKRAASVPPIPAYLPPPDDLELHALLQREGMQHPPTERPDAVLVWDWRQAALKVPALDEALAAQTALAQGLTKLSGEQASQIVDLTAARDAWKDTATEQGKRAEALQGQAAALGKAVAAERTQKWVVGGVGVAGVLWVALRKK